MHRIAPVRRSNCVMTSSQVKRDTDWQRDDRAKSISLGVDQLTSFYQQAPQWHSVMSAGTCSIDYTSQERVCVSALSGLNTSRHRAAIHQLAAVWDDDDAVTTKMENDKLQAVASIKATYGALLNSYDGYLHFVGPTWNTHFHAKYAACKTLSLTLCTNTQAAWYWAYFINFNSLGTQSFWGQLNFVSVWKRDA